MPPGICEHNFSLTYEDFVLKDICSSCGQARESTFPTSYVAPSPQTFRTIPGHEYEQLEGEHPIRLLHILPGVAHEPIFGRVSAIGHITAAIDQYAAISYTWKNEIGNASKR